MLLLWLWVLVAHGGCFHMAQIYWGMYISLYLEVIGIMHSRIYTMEWLCVDMVWSDIHISMYILTCNVS